MINKYISKKEIKRISNFITNNTMNNINKYLQLPVHYNINYFYIIFDITFF